MPVLRFSAAGRVFERSMDWDSLSEAKERLKAALGPAVSFDRASKTWVVSGYVEDVERASRVVSEVFGVSPGEAEAALAEANRRFFEGHPVRVRLEEEEWRGRRRLWVVLEAGHRGVYWLARRELSGLLGEEGHLVAMNVEVLRQGRVEYEEKRFRVAYWDGESLTLKVAPYVYAGLRRRLLRLGVRLEEELRVPGEERVFEARLSARLRPYQEEALEAWRRAGYRGAIQIPTGGGKTLIGLAAMAELGVPTVVFVPSANLLYQWRDKIVEVLGVDRGLVGLLGAGHRGLGKPILVAIYDSGVRRAREIAERYAFYLYDEGHHVAAETFKETAWHRLGPYVMVLSATVERADGNEKLIYAMTGPKVYEVSYEELTEKGWLAPVRIRFVSVPLTREEAEKYRAMSEELARLSGRMRRLLEEYESEAYERGFSSAEEYLRRTRHPEYRELNRLAASLRQRMRLLEAGSEAKTAAGAALAERLAAEGRKVFVFTVLERQARDVYRELARRLGAGRVAIVTGKTSAAERERAFRLFREGRVRVIVTTTVLDEGVDAPDADAAVVVSSRALSDPRQWVQRIGRTVRPLPDKSVEILILQAEVPGGRGFEERGFRSLVGELESVYGPGSVERTPVAPEELGVNPSSLRPERAGRRAEQSSS